MGQPEEVLAYCNHCQREFCARTSTDGLCVVCFINGHRGLNCGQYCKTESEPQDPRILKALETIYGKQSDSG